MTAVKWLDAMSPWPRDGFGLERMLELLAELGDPQDAFPAIHVVGTNGKSTATVTIEQLLLAEELSVGATISPHVASWSERVRIDGAEADFEVAVARVRPVAAVSRSARPVRLVRTAVRGRKSPRVRDRSSDRESANGTWRHSLSSATERGREVSAVNLSGGQDPLGDPGSGVQP